MRPWSSFWTSRVNPDPLPVKPHSDVKAKSLPLETSQTPWFAGDKVYATSALGGWDQQLEPQSVSQPYIIQPEDSVYQALGRPLVLNRMDSPLQEPEDSVSSIIRCAHEDEMMELVAVIKQLREQAAKDAEMIAELRGQAQDNAHAIGVVRIENERMMKELSAAASEARVAAAAITAAAASATEAVANSPPTQSPPTHSPPARGLSPRSPPPHNHPPHDPPPHSSPPHSPPPHSPPPHSLPPQSPPPQSPPPHSPPTPIPPPHSPPTSSRPTLSPSTSSRPTPSPSTPAPPSPPKKGKGKQSPKQAAPVSTPSSPRTTYTNPPSFTAIPQPTASSANLTIFETYDRMINLLKNKPRPDVQLGDYPWPMFPEPSFSFPQRITLRSEVTKEKVVAFVRAYASAYGLEQRGNRGEAMLKAWRSIMDRSEDAILKGTAARAFTYMDMATRSL
jgi:hypothetical protein